ncbi:demethoxyubiquinone hydroxylase family protein, partial [Xanthomonas perforans]
MYGTFGGGASCSNNRAMAVGSTAERGQNRRMTQIPP